MRSESGQVAPAVLGFAVAIVFAASLLSEIGGATTGASRAQRAADLGALSAARGMYESNSQELASGRSVAAAAAVSRSKALVAARRSAIENRIDPDRLEVEFGPGDPPLRVEVRVSSELDPRSSPGGEVLSERKSRLVRVVAHATAEVAPPPGWWTGLPTVASGGGYSGPLVYRNGEGMRPDVARAFDRLARAARSAGVNLYVVSGFRSDAEQAELFARHPDPKWVAPPGKSLHRCATELDLGPGAAYGWLGRNARRFGFVQRYSWEPWHYGFVAGPAPCSASAQGAAVGEGWEETLPTYVPRRFRPFISRAASRTGVSATLLAAQLMAESGFDPRAVSSAGAMGIAQFMPATAREWGLRDPFDPRSAILAQAKFMASLLRRFRSIPLALAAYNAGPGAVGSCRCVPPYPETRAYVTRILSLMEGAGALALPGPEVRLVA